MAYRDAVLADSPTLFWEMQETSGTTATDTGSALDNGTYANATLNQTGSSGYKAVSFNGTSSGLSSSTTISIPQVSAEILAYFASTSQNGFFISKGNVNTDWEIFLENGNLVWRGGAVGSDLCRTAAPTAGWHHIVGTQTGTTANLYVDGQLVKSATVTAISNGTGNIFVGRYDNAGTGGYYYAGLLSHAAVYSTVLTAAQITTHYNTLSGGNARITQTIGETLVLATQANALVSQVVAETLVSVTQANARISQVVLEALVAPTNSNARVSQEVIEAAVTSLPGAIAEGQTIIIR